MDSTTQSDPDYTLPALLPPPGVRSNFVKPTTRANDLIITGALCLAFLSTSVVMRFYTKLRIQNQWGWEDWICIPATIGTTSFIAVSISVLGEGVGPHQWDVPFTAFTPSLLRRFVVLDMLYSPTALMAKTSLLLLYLRIFRPHVKLRYCIYFSIAFLALFYIGTFVAYAVLSIPRPGQSQLAAILSIDTARDIPLGITQGAVSVVSDFYIFCLPIPVVWKLQLRPRRKIGVLAIFLTGFLACVASAFGLYTRVGLTRNSDVTWKLVYVLLCVIVELTVGVICSCLPSFPGFFRHYLPLLRAILSLLHSSFRSLRLSKLQNRSSERESATRLATQDIRVTLGSRVDGRGLFIDSTNAFAIEQSPLALASPVHEREPQRTRRDYYDRILESQQSPSHHSSTAQSRSSQTGDSSFANSNVNEKYPTQSSPATHWFLGTTRKKSRIRRDAPQDVSSHRNYPDKGYWDSLSFFRSTDPQSTQESVSSPSIRTGQT